jgi:hypothetical protein
MEDRNRDENALSKGELDRPQGSQSPEPLVKHPLQVREAIQVKIHVTETFFKCQECVLKDVIHKVDDVFNKTQCDFQTSCTTLRSTVNLKMTFLAQLDVMVLQTRQIDPQLG